MSAYTSLHQNENPAVSSALFDTNGFLLEHVIWNRELASMIAEQEGLDHLTVNHWRVINFVRKRYVELEYPPEMRSVCRATGLDRSQVKSLFGACRTMWRIAGLPNPGEEARAYMS